MPITSEISARPRVFVRVNFLDGEEFIYAKSNQVPGLFICASSRAEARKRVVAAIRTLFARSYQMIVEVLPENEETLWASWRVDGDAEKFGVARL